MVRANVVYIAVKCVHIREVKLILSASDAVLMILLHVKLESGVDS
jgi:hypothetical protein